MKKPTAIRVAATSARVIGGLVVSAAVVVGTAVAIPMAWPAVSHEPAHEEIVPITGDVMLTCAGPFRALGRNPLNAAQLSVAGTPEVIFGASGETSIEQVPLTISDIEDGDTGTIYIGRTDDRSGVLLSAAESITLADADLAGFAGAACRPPSMESWLVGGAANTGTSDVVLISNPSEVTATASFTIFGGQGEKRSRDVVLPPRTQVAVPLAAGAARERTPVVRVTATGAPVRAMLQSSLIRTLDPSGIDLQDGTGGPQNVQTLVGVTVMAQATDAAATTILRVLSPSVDTRVKVTARSAIDAKPAGTPLTVTLKAGQPSEINITGLAPGVYSFEIEADAPVVAAAWQSSGIMVGADYAWMTPAPEIFGTTPFSVPTGPATQMHIYNTGVDDATVVLRDAGDETGRTVTVPAGGSVLESLTEGSYLLDTDAPVRAAITMSGVRAIAGWPLWPVEAVANAVVVYP